MFGTSVPVLQTRCLTKAFSRVVAVKDVSVHLGKGEILAILGENGAGKTTLMNLLFGLYAPSSGELFINGKQVNFSSPRDAIAEGLGMVHQHFMLVPTLTVTANIILGYEPVRFGHILYKEARRRVRELSETYGLMVDPDALLEGLPVGLQQRVEILKTLYRDAHILILDEPTAVLTPREVHELFEVLRRLAENGTSIIIITHKLEEVRNLSDRVYVLRRGLLVGERRTSETSPSELAELMVGRSVVFRTTRDTDARAGKERPIMSVEGLSVRTGRGLPALKGLSLSVSPGEILGIAGVEGNGQQELCEVVAGLRRPDSGLIMYKDQDVISWSIRRRRARGMGYIPQDRRGSALVLPFSVEENLALGESDERPLSRWGLLNSKELRKRTLALIKDYDIRTEDSEMEASTLSGGNQQKLILAREFSRKPAFLLVSQPTRGLDVGAIEYVYSRILALKAQGVAILLISMELEELFTLSDRLAVLHEGELVYDAKVEEASESLIGEYMIRGRAAGGDS